LNGAQYFSNGIPQANGTMIVNIFSLDPITFAQVQAATLTGKYSTDFATFSGTIKIGNKSASITLKAQ
jgi:hypothetical protein